MEHLSTGTGVDSGDPESHLGVRRMGDSPGPLVKSSGLRPRDDRAEAEAGNDCRWLATGSTSGFSVFDPGPNRLIRRAPPAACPPAPSAGVGESHEFLVNDDADMSEQGREIEERAYEVGVDFKESLDRRCC